MQTCYVHVWQFRCALKNEMEENPKRNASLHVVVDTCRHGCIFGSWCTRISLLRQPPSTTVNIESRLFGRISNAMASINVSLTSYVRRTSAQQQTYVQTKNAA